MAFRTLIVDDHEAARRGLKILLLNAGSPIERAVVTESSGVLDHLNDGEFDAVLLDVQMKGTDGLSLLGLIRSRYPDLPVIFISAYDYPVYLARAVANGAHDYVLKSDPIETIQRAVEHACQNGRGYPGGLFDRVREKLASPIQATELPEEFPLTGREAQVLRHVAFGLSNREIARSLKISVETVKEHVQNILRKSGASDRTDAAVRAVRSGLLD